MRRPVRFFHQFIREADQIWIDEDDGEKIVNIAYDGTGWHVDIMQLGAEQTQDPVLGPVRFSAQARLVPWYVVVNDLVGGFAVSHIDKPLSEQNFQDGEGDLFDSVTRELADYIVGLHNAQLEGGGPDEP